MFNAGIIASSNLAAAPTDPLFANVISLLHFQGADGSTTFTDEIGNVWTAAGNAQIDTANFKWGNSSGWFQLTTDWIETPDSATLRFGTDAFCVEGWFAPDSAGTKNVYVKGINTTGGISLYVSTSELRFRCNGTSDIVHNPSLTPDEFVHVAFTRSGSTRTIYLNGISVATDNGAGINMDDTSTVYLGSCFPSNSLFRYTGWIGDFRITKGNVRYTGNFTPENYPFPNSGP